MNQWKQLIDCQLKAKQGYCRVRLDVTFYYVHARLTRQIQLKTLRMINDVTHKFVALELQRMIVISILLYK